MKFFLTGVETNNKGAELMLYAILQEIERVYPDSTVYIEPKMIRQGTGYIKTSLNLVLWDSLWAKFHRKFHVYGILRRLKLPQLPTLFSLPQIDYMLDGSGLYFTDNMADDIILWQWKNIFRQLKKNKSKQIFLPQAFGPLEKCKTKQAIKLISDNSNLIFAREHVSYKFLKDSGCMDMSKVRTQTDFTSLVEGVFPSQYEYLRDGICIIPNMQMINKGVVSDAEYYSYLKHIICDIDYDGRKVYLLNHEGISDEPILCIMKEMLDDKIEIVSGLNALETKGLISSAYLVITSRFHGLASALNSCVPVLSTSWSHKYYCLYEDYGQIDRILTITDFETDTNMIKELLDPCNNKKIRIELQHAVSHIKASTTDMWIAIWKL